MNGIKMKDCKFYVDEKARTVVCVIPKTRNMLNNFISDNFQFRDIDIYYAIDPSSLNLDMPYSFMGKAVCSPEDEWNEELGRKIAFARAKDKCYKSFFKRANMLVQTVDRRLGDMIDTFNNFGLKLESKREALQHQIDDAIYPGTEE